MLSHVYVTIGGGFGLDIGLIDHLRTQLGTTSNYSAVANVRTLQITTAHAKYYPTCYVSTGRFLVTASNSGDSSVSALKPSLNGGSLPTASSLHSIPYKTDFVAPVVLLITPRHGPPRQHRAFSYANRFRGNTRHPATGFLIPFIKNPLPQQRALVRDRYPATGLHAIINL
jgi:hypothetical protein